jgi:hypothetical protein
MATRQASLDTYTPDQYREPMPRNDDRRSLKEEPTLLARVLMQALMQLASERHLSGSRVVYRQNPKGEHVVALIFPPQPP